MRLFIVEIPAYGNSRDEGIEKLSREAKDIKILEGVNGMHPFVKVIMLFEEEPKELKE